MFARVDNAKHKLDMLVKLSKKGVMPEIGEFIDNLTKDELKWILRLLVYGGWLDFDVKV